jgi:hypothetical protein
MAAGPIENGSGAIDRFAIAISNIFLYKKQVVISCGIGPVRGEAVCDALAFCSEHLASICHKE